MTSQTSESVFLPLAKFCLHVSALSCLLFIVLFLFSTGINAIDILYSYATNRICIEHLIPLKHEEVFQVVTYYTLAQKLWAKILMHIYKCQAKSSQTPIWKDECAMMYSLPLPSVLFLEVNWPIYFSPLVTWECPFSSSMVKEWCSVHILLSKWFSTFKPNGDIKSCPFLCYN